MPTVAALIVEGLRQAAVSRLFGVPGGGLGHEILEAARLGGLPVVSCHQEWVACIMAGVTGELTGHPGAALSTLGPGVTGSVSGLGHAFLDRSPMIYLSARHPDSALAFVTDHAALLAPVVKGSATATADSVGDQVAWAAALAVAEPRGPVHLDLPADLAGRPAPRMVAATASSPLTPPDAAALDRAAEMIIGARRPIVVAGLQCRPPDATWLRAFCEALPAPVLTTCKAKGAIPDPHPLAMGVFTGGALEAPVVRRADLIIAFGLDPAELMPRRWPYSAPVLALTRCASSDARIRAPGGGAYFAPALEVVGDLGSILEEMAPRLVSRYRADWDVVEIDRLRRERRGALEIALPGLAVHRVVQLAREFTPAGTIAAVDAGAHGFPVTAYWDAVEPGELLISNGLATPGFALPAAIAAQLVHPERRVVCFTGHGELMMVAAELETAARLRLPLLIIVLGDGAPSPVALARTVGLYAFEAQDEDAFRSALFSALAAPGPTLIDARVDPAGSRRTLEIVGGAPEG